MLFKQGLDSSFSLTTPPFSHHLKASCFSSCAPSFVPFLSYSTVFISHFTSLFSPPHVNVVSVISISPPALIQCVCRSVFLSPPLWLGGPTLFCPSGEPSILSISYADRLTDNIWRRGCHAAPKAVRWILIQATSLAWKHMLACMDVQIRTCNEISTCCTHMHTKPAWILISFNYLVFIF